MPFTPPTLTEPCDYRAARANARELHAKAVTAADAYRRMCEIAAKEPDSTVHVDALARAQSDAHHKGQCHRLWTLARHYLLGRPYGHAEAMPAPRQDQEVELLSRGITTVLLEVHTDPALRIPRNGYPSSLKQSEEHLRLRKAVTAWIVQTYAGQVEPWRRARDLAEFEPQPPSMSPGLIFSQPGPFD